MSTILWVRILDHQKGNTSLWELSQIVSPFNLHHLYSSNQTLSGPLIFVDPLSRGSVHISSTSPSDPPEFDSGVMNNMADLSVHVWAYKM